jgi:hypothetical protein
MDWTVKPHEDANHPPVPELRHPATISVRSGEAFELGGRATDPDGDSLSYVWQQYLEAGSCRMPVRFLSAENLARVGLVAPRVEETSTVHFVFRVTDKGDPPLSRYRRVIVTLTP